MVTQITIRLCRADLVIRCADSKDKQSARSAIARGLTASGDTVCAFVLRAFCQEKKRMKKVTVTFPTAPVFSSNGEVDYVAANWSPQQRRKCADKLERWIRILRMSAEIQDGKMARSYVN